VNTSESNRLAHRPQPEPIEDHQPLGNILRDGGDAIDWGNRVSYILGGFILGLYLLGWLFDHRHGLHPVELALCFISVLVGGAYLGLSRQRVIKWVLVLTAVLTLGLLAF
jgi:hypothetical protein